MCGKPIELSAEDAELIERVKNIDESINAVDFFIKSCNAPDDSEISNLYSLAKKLVGARKELDKLPGQHKDLCHSQLDRIKKYKAYCSSQLDQIGENMRGMIIAFVPIPRKCRHEIPFCEWCGGFPGCEWCPDNVGVDQRSKRWKQHIRKCDAGPLIRLTKRHQHGLNREVARANDLDYPEEDTATGLFD
jgi:hypothetical protein